MSTDMFPQASRELNDKRQQLTPAATEAFKAFSKAVFADGALQGSGIAELGEQPLGERVFGHEPARRDHLQLARFDIAANPRCPAATVWGRRSRLFLGQWPLLVHELFLPSLVCDKELE